jgi:TonB family protein
VYPNPNRRSFFNSLISIAGSCFVGQTQVRSLYAQNGSKPKPVDEAEIYEPGGEVKAPKLVHYVEPNFSSSSQEAFVEGVVRISAVVTTEGSTTSLKVTSGLNAEEDKTAMEAVKQWRFQPGTKKGEPVKVRVTVEVVFHLL